MLGADVVDDDGPMTICETVVAGIITVDGTIVDGTTAVGVFWGVPGLVLIVTDGTPATVEHMFSNARNDNA